MMGTDIVGARLLTRQHASSRHSPLARHPELRATWQGA